MSEIKIEGGNLDRANRLLAGIGGGVLLRNAIYNALNRTAITARTKAARFATQQYYLSSASFKKYTNIKYHIHYQGGHLSGSALSCAVTFAGRVIPLIEFKTKVTKNGVITARVKKSGGGGALWPKTFYSTMGTGHVGIYERVTNARLPITELKGPSTAHMMANEAVVKSMNDAMRDTFEQRMDHEILRILNGFGGAHNGLSDADKNTLASRLDAEFGDDE